MHTKLPWRIQHEPWRKHPPENDSVEFVVVGTPEEFVQFGAIVANINGSATPDPHPVAKANAELIVRAVNAHHELVAALRTIVAAWDDIGVTFDKIEIARAALAKATT